MTFPIRPLLVALALGWAAMPAGAQVLLKGEAASPGGAAHLSITHLADVASQQGIATIQVLEGQTLTNSVQNLAEGRTDITPTPLSLPFFLSRGIGPYSAVGPEEGARLAGNLRALYPFNAGGVHLLTHESSGIRTWDDLRGKTVFVGPPRGAALVTARQTIELVTGLKDEQDYRGLQLNWGQLPAALVDGSADAFVFSAPFPSDQVITASSAGRVNIISIPQEVFDSAAFQTYVTAPGNAPVTVAQADMGYGPDLGVTLISDDGVFRGVGVPFADIVRADMDFELARALTAAHIGSLDLLRSKAPFAAKSGYGELAPEVSGFCGAVPLKYHPGAIAAWEEAGFDVPDCAKP